MKFKAETIAVLIIVALVLMLLVSDAKVFAHGGEDHAEEKAPVVSADAGTSVTRVARIGDYEVTIKNPSVEPDKAVTARVFVTRFETNAPVGQARISILLGDDRSLQEIAATATQTPGIYEAKLPPLPKGQYKLAARIDVSGTSGTADYGVIKVSPAPPPTVESGSSWARTALFTLVLLLALGVTGVVVYRYVQNARGSKNGGGNDQVKGETVAA